MGSNGQHSTAIQGGGRLLGRQVADILEGRVRDAQGEIPKRIVVLPNNKKSFGREGFIVDMTNAPEQEREAFLKIWKGRSNTDNSQAVWNSTYALQIDRGASETVARNRADVARARASRDTMRGILARDAQQTNPKFSDISIKRNTVKYYQNR